MPAVAVVEPRPLATLVDTQLAVEKRRVATQVRRSHLARDDRHDPDTNWLLGELEGLEERITDRVADIITGHPAYPWFSRVKGIGNENIAKVVGQIDIMRAPMISSLWKFAGMHVVQVEVSREEQFEEIQRSADALQVKLEQLRKKYAKHPEKEEKDIAVLTSSAIGGLTESLSRQLDNLEPVVRGYAPRRQSGQKLEYNSQLRVMCFRLAVSLLRAQGCFAEYYGREKAKLATRYENQGILIVPTLELPKVNGKVVEVAGTIASGHVHMQAQRKMIKLFLGCLWLVWREAEGLPTRPPYAIEQLGHTHLISPWEMTDR